MAQFVVQDVGVMGYGQALELQRLRHEQVLTGLAPPTILLVEHPPVITVSQRRLAPQHIVASAATLARMGIEVHPTDRGGDVTYHGPGQLVAYPILRLADLGLNIGRYMRLLEQVVIDTVAVWGIESFRDPPHTGVWVVGRSSAQLPAKIAAFGVRVRRNVSMHGLALNVTTDLAHFQAIVPCGLIGRGVTSLQALLGEQCPSMAAVKRELIVRFERHWPSAVCREATA